MPLVQCLFDVVDIVPEARCKINIKKEKQAAQEEGEEEEGEEDEEEGEEGEIDDDCEDVTSDFEDKARGPKHYRVAGNSITTDSEPQERSKAVKEMKRQPMRKRQAQRVSGADSGEDMEISEDESQPGPPSASHLSPKSRKSPSPMIQQSISLRLRPVQIPTEDRDVDEGVEVDMEDDEEDKRRDDEDANDSDYREDEDEDPQDEPSSESELDIAATDTEDPSDQVLSDEYLRLMPRPVLEKILQRLLKPPQSPQTRRVVQSLIQESVPETLAAYDTSVRIKVNETYTTMVQEMQDQHSSLTSDDFADVMARFLRNEVKVLQAFPGSNKSTFDLILYIAEHSFGDLELDNRRGFGERTHFDKAADRALLYVAEQRLKEEGPSFRATIPGYLETIRSQAMYLYRHSIHPKSWFPASTAFLQASLQVTATKACGRLRSQTRSDH